VIRYNIEEPIQRAKSSNEAREFLVSSVLNMITWCNLHKKNMIILLVSKFQQTYKYTLQMMFDQRVGVKESRGLKNYQSLAKERMRGKT
jgi:hypothetical protein